MRTPGPLLEPFSGAATPVPDASLRVDGLTVSRKPQRAGMFALPTFRRITVLDDVNIEVAPGELLLIVGHSGCGKTTLLRALAGIRQPFAGLRQAGKITLEGKNLAAADFATAVLRKRIEIVAGLPDPDYVRGDEVFLMDEAFIGLDHRYAGSVVGHIRAIKDKGARFVMVTHNLPALADAAERVCLMEAGRIIWQGPPATLRANRAALPLSVRSYVSAAARVFGWEP